MEDGHITLVKAACGVFLIKLYFKATAGNVTNVDIKGPKLLTK
jgi:hypothetical protein